MADDVEQVKNMVSKCPDWMQEVEDGIWKVQGKKKEYLLEETDARNLEQAFRTAENTNTASVERILLKKSMKEPKLTDDEVDKIRGSDYMRLKLSIVYIYNLQDFF